MSFQWRHTTCTEAVAKGPNGLTSIPGDGITPINICLHVEDAATSADLTGVPLEVRVIVGTVGMSGTSKYSGLLFSTAGGIAQISYRGDGTSFGGDTAIATSESGQAVAVAAIDITPPAGRFATRVVTIEAADRVIAAPDARTASAYRSPAPGALMAAQVQDAKGLGVNGHVLLVTARGARLVANPGLALPPAVACAGITAASLVLVTNPTEALVPGGPPRPGAAGFAVCATTDEPPGEALVRIESVSDPLLPAATVTLPVSGRPASIVTRVEDGGTVARVLDADRRPVADGTPVRFAIAPAAGAVSTRCALTRNGETRVVVALDTPLATLAVSAEYATAGAAATCGAPGTGRVEIAVPVASAMPTPPPVPAVPAEAAGIPTDEGRSLAGAPSVQSP